MAAGQQVVSGTLQARQCSGLIWYKILSAYNFGPSHTEIVTVLLTILAVGAGRNCKLAFFPGGKPPTA